MSGEIQDGGGDAGAARIDALSKGIVTAAAGGDHLAASKLAGEREVLATQLYGDTPIQHGVHSVGDESPAEAYRPPAEYVAPAEPGTAEALGEDLHALGPEGSEIVADWGGPQSQTFRENGGFIKHAVEYVTRDDPGLAELLAAEVEDEHGNVTRLGNHPGLIKAAALFGRLLAHRSGLEVDALRASAKRAAISGSPAPSSSGGDMDSLTKALLEAHGRGDSMVVTRLSRQREELARRIHGDVPVDGRTR